jgi:threonine/homoserine/homoserine lactone efflux protein
MNIASFIIYCIIVTFTPGPTNIAILSIANNCVLKKTFRYVIGAGTALATLLVISVIFNSVLVGIIPKILAVMRIIGCAYMLYLAYQVSRMHVSNKDFKQTVNFVSGFIMQFANPKVWIFTMTVIPSFIMPYYQSKAILLMFALLIAIIAFCALTTWALFGTIFKRFLQKYQKTVNIILALLLVYSAIEVSGIIELLKR